MDTRTSGPFEIVRTERHVAVYYRGRPILLRGKSDWLIGETGKGGKKITNNTNI